MVGELGAILGEMIEVRRELGRVGWMAGGAAVKRVRRDVETGAKIAG